MKVVLVLFGILSILHTSCIDAFSPQTFTINKLVDDGSHHHRLRQPQFINPTNSERSRFRDGGNENIVACSATKKTNDEFWAAQRKLMGDMQDKVETEDGIAKATQKDLYNKQVSSLVSETFYFSILLFSAIWFVTPNPFTALSYLLGALLGTAYTYGLGKYVQSLGGSAYDMEDVQGSGVGSARFAFLIVLFIFVGKFRSEGLQEIPAIMGFFTYQISTLSQGLKDASAED